MEMTLERNVEMQYSPALENMLFVNLLSKNKTLFYQV